MQFHNDQGLTVPVEFLEQILGICLAWICVEVFINQTPSTTKHEQLIHPPSEVKPYNNIQGYLNSYNELMIIYMHADPVTFMCIGGGTGGGQGGQLPPQNPGPNDVTNQPDLSLFMIDTPRYSQKLPRIASKVDHCANFPSFLSSRQQ